MKFVAGNFLQVSLRNRHHRSSIHRPTTSSTKARVLLKAGPTRRELHRAVTIYDIAAVPSGVWTVEPVTVDGGRALRTAGTRAAQRFAVHHS